MTSYIAERAIEDALQNGKALFKFISPNDAGLTGSHQRGFYLPKSAWQLFSPHAPRRGTNEDSRPRIIWPDGRQTNSRVVWYGNKTRSEYRLTRFGHDFPFLTPDSVGSLFVLIPLSLDEFRAYVLEADEDIADFQAALGIEAIESWGVYEAGAEPQPLSEDECINNIFRSFTEAVTKFPETKTISVAVQQVLSKCIRDFQRLPPDDQLMRYVNNEYVLFKMIERKLTEPEVTRLFKDVDDFIKTAAEIMNRRKSRAGRSLEHHVEKLFRDAGLPFDFKPKIDGKVEPDILIPSKAAYEDPKWPEDKLFIVGIKTSCKDRWRQVLNEGKRVKRKHILTLQQGISAPQLQEMYEAGLTLVVPKSIHSFYPGGGRIKILTVESFITSTRALFA